MLENKYINFWEYYIKNISPRLEQIDVLLKSNGHNIPLKTVSLLLDIPLEEVENIMSKKNIRKITSKNFLSIMLDGKSYLCNILKREFEKKSPKEYSPKDISYIYGIDYTQIENAFNFLDIKTISSKSLKIIFMQINV